MFSARDLALLLPDEVDSTAARRNAKEDGGDHYEAPKPKVDASKRVTRYFPGKAPEWVDPSISAASTSTGSANVVVEAPVDTPVDRRLARIAKPASVGTTEPSAPRRRIYEAQVVVDDVDSSSAPASRREGEIFAPGSDDDEEEDELEAMVARRRSDGDAVEAAARRERIRTRVAAASSAAEATPAAVSSSEESESEYETDSDEESSEEEVNTKHTLMKPVFVPKSRRTTVADKDAVLQEEEAQQRKKELELEERKRSTHVLVAESVRKQDERDKLLSSAATDVDSDAGMPDDTDDADDDEEFENWKIREVARIKKEAESRIESVLEKAEIERRRNLTEEQRYAEDLKNGRFDKKEKEKWKFLQKYYHKGVFYMDQESIKKKETDVRLREYNEPTLEDRFNKEALPAVLQVKNFGKRGRTKYTHLLDQDTTHQSAPTLYTEKKFTPHVQPVLEKYMNKRAGVGDIERSAKRRKEGDHT
jgi:microfibrillar-associated protein 1